MKSLPFLILLFFPFISQAQPATTGKFSIGIIVAPELSYRHINASDSTDWIKDISNDRDIKKFGYSAGLNILYSISPRLSVESGLLYTNKGWKTKEMPFSTGDSDSLSIIYAGTVSTTYSFHYLDVPLKINYALMSKRFKLFITAGVIADIFIDSKQTSIIKGSSEHKSTSTDKSFNNLSLSATAGIGASYDISKHISLRVVPTYSRMLTHIRNTPNKYYLWTAGLNIGVVYNLQHK